jgi:hypothetical protein
MYIHNPFKKVNFFGFHFVCFQFLIIEAKYQLSIGKSFEINYNQFHAKMHKLQVANMFELVFKHQRLSIL